MRFKYYLRGIGIGVTLATLLLTVSFYFGRDFLYNKSLSDEEIIQKATALGMVMPEGTEVTESSEGTESIEGTDEVVITEEESVPLAGEITEAEDAMSEEVTKVGEDAISADSSVEETVTYIPFTVRAGESSEVISNHLKKAGIIDDSDEFNKYLNKCKVDNLIQNGTFYVKQGSSYDDLVAVLVNKDVRTTTPPKN
ncbi:endolytic transglycosylase MltG [Pseudobutyrivibrio xylanivorans]|uniref:YceG-like family protein n=1 Tax=Pseudobutyrivibrio xylanivorans DSM 14809 TaxID=1123012 RepID=A0A1M6EH84_PSEXY|nr:endolytic transglycosylase MltG [Pseudobutyrivibrio xylanivorans]SHI84749.1 hypothetical protein SAMN02745725_01213 [Pseudobutyrivibrio xylanivorans DSM 14809]